MFFRITRLSARRPIKPTSTKSEADPDIGRTRRLTTSLRIEVDGRSFFRTGDLGRVDEEGYFFITDRLKRMINSAGFKIFPAEVETIMYRHPAIWECCIIGASDERRGEIVKAVVALRQDASDITAEKLIEWARTQMAVYKAPRIVEFVDALPRGGTGTLLWKELQDKESSRIGDRMA